MAAGKGREFSGVNRLGDALVTNQTKAVGITLGRGVFQNLPWQSQLDDRNIVVKLSENYECPGRADVFGTAPGVQWRGRLHIRS
jgi:hypothetical protein